MANDDAIYIGELALPMIKGDKGDKGDQGPQGIQGIQGVAGESSTIDIGLVQTGSPTTPTTVVNTGTPSHAILDFVIQKGDKGDKGDTGEIVSVSATTLSSTSQAYAINNGTTTEAELELGIPKGIGISNVTIDEHFNVIVTLENNTEINAGSLSELDEVNTYIQGATNVTSIYPWDPTIQYYNGDFVLHNNHICECLEDRATLGTYVQNEWSEWDILNLLNYVRVNSENASSRIDNVETVIETVLPNMFEAKSNKVTSISSSSTDTQYPSAKAVYDATKDCITSTDYAVTNHAAGIIKAKSSNGLEVGSGIYAGELWGAQKDYSTYISDQYFPRSGIICKGTLENVIEGKGLTTKAYVDSLVGDIDSALDAINGEEV